MKTGTVISYNDQRGFGFIKVNNGGLTGVGKDLYVHASELLNRALELKPGDEVSFEIGTSPRGPYAARVAVLRRGKGHEVRANYAQRID